MTNTRDRFISHAQQYGWKNQLREKFTPSGVGRAIRENYSTDYQSAMNSLRESDERMRDIFLGKEGSGNDMDLRDAIKGAKGAFKENRYLDISYYLQKINSSINAIIEEGNKVEDLSKEQIESELSQSPENYMSPEEFGDMFSSASGDFDIVKNANIFTNFMSKIFGPAMFNKEYAKQLRERKMAIQSLLSKAEVLVRGVANDLDRMSKSRAKGDISSWIQNFSKIPNQYNNYKSEATPLYNNGLRDLEQRFKKEQAEKENSRNQEFSVEIDENAEPAQKQKDSVTVETETETEKETDVDVTVTEPPPAPWGAVEQDDSSESKIISTIFKLVNESPDKSKDLVEFLPKLFKDQPNAALELAEVAIQDLDKALSLYRSIISPEDEVIEVDDSELEYIFKLKDYMKREPSVIDNINSNEIGPQFISALQGEKDFKYEAEEFDSDYEPLTEEEIEEDAILLSKSKGQTRENKAESYRSALSEEDFNKILKRVKEIEELSKGDKTKEITTKKEKESVPEQATSERPTVVDKAQTVKEEKIKKYRDNAFEALKDLSFIASLPKMRNQDKVNISKALSGETALMSLDKEDKKAVREILREINSKGGIDFVETEDSEEEAEVENVVEDIVDNFDPEFNESSLSDFEEGSMGDFDDEIIGDGPLYSDDGLPDVKSSKVEKFLKMLEASSKLEKTDPQKSEEILIKAIRFKNEWF